MADKPSFSDERRRPGRYYLAHKGERFFVADGQLWEQVIAEDFMELGKAGLSHPMMAEIEKRLGVSR